MLQVPIPTTEELVCQNFKYFGLIVLLLVAVILPFGHKQLHSIEIIFNKIACRRKISILLVFLLAFLGAALVSSFIFWPIPFITDENSYLLAADTFANGRLTNPTHQMWQHFETFYVLQQPSYASQYPPGQGLIMALGQVLMGYPIAGVWLSIALTCAATCWMLQAWVPPRWALLGALLMILKLGLFSYWSQSFWGGAVAATGGAIVLGAFRRIVKRPKISHSLLLGLGLGILANSRPYEGLIFSLPSLTYLLFWLKKQPSQKKLCKQVFLPLFGTLFLIGLMMVYYNWVVTGKPWLMPFQLYQEIYSTISNFLWIKPRPNLQYNHEVFRKVYLEFYFDLYNQNKGLINYGKFTLFKLENLFKFFIGISFAVPLIVLPVLRKNFWVKFALFNILFLILGMLVVLFNYPHYAAPGVCLIYFLVLQCMRRIYVFHWKNRPIGQLMVWSVPIYCILLVVLPLSLKVDPFYYVNPSLWEIPRQYLPSSITKRQEIISKLKESNNKYLIIVEYLPEHNLQSEWVYNEADIDNAKIVWARSMDFEKNCKLIKYFSDRKVIFLEIGAEPDVVKKYYSIKGCE